MDVGPKRASVDSTAPNPQIGARKSTDSRFPDPARAWGEQADRRNDRLGALFQRRALCLMKPHPMGRPDWPFSSKKDIGLVSEP
jgi:hypothetical protein